MNMNTRAAFHCPPSGVLAWLAAAVFSSALAQESPGPPRQAAKTQSTESVFHAAVRRGDADSVRQMISKNPWLIHAVHDESQCSPLYTAIDEGRRKCRTPTNNSVTNDAESVNF